MINTQNISVINLGKEAPGFCSVKKVLPNEVAGVTIEYISVKGSYRISEPASPDIYDVLLTLKGEADVEFENEIFNVGPASIARMLYNKAYVIQTGEGKEFHFIRFRKLMDESDKKAISKINPEGYSKAYIKLIEECPIYTEDIKSSKTLNRIILPEGMVPRFCMGSVKTEGPDEVKEHEHTMLDQLFFGLEGCKCTCVANGKKKILEENMMLHIPLGSKHSVSVEYGNTLFYIWFDFFLTLEGQKYMNEQHHLDK